MSRHQRRIYSKEFKQQIVNLYLAGKLRTKIIQEYELTASVFDKRVKQPGLLTKKMSSSLHCPCGLLVFLALAFPSFQLTPCLPVPLYLASGRIPSTSGSLVSSDEPDLEVTSFSPITSPW